MIDIINHW